MKNLDELIELKAKADAGKFKTWTLGGSNGRGITTPSGYYGDGFLADTDTKANAEYITELHNANLPERLKKAEAVIEFYLYEIVTKDDGDEAQEYLNKYRSE